MPRTVRTKEERIAALNEKIAFHEKHIAILKKKVEELENPSNAKVNMRTIAKTAKEKGITPQQLMDMISAMDKE